MRRPLAPATFVLALSVLAHGQESWDLAKCRQSLTEGIAKAGHFCTLAHLDADAALLANDPNIREDIRSSPQLLREAAETGTVEGVAMLMQMMADHEATRATTVRWTAGSSYSKEFLLLGSRARVIETDSLRLMAYIESNDDPLRVPMFFLNKSKEPLDVIPDNFTLAVIEPKAKAKPLPYLSPQQVAKKIENEAAWLMVAEAISSMGRAIAGTTTSTTATVTARDAYGRSAYGTYNGLTTTYDNAANQQQTAANMARIAGASEEQKLRQTTGALLPNTVFPGQTYGGIVHVKREKRAELLLLRVPVGGQVFEFPLEMPKR